MKQPTQEEIQAALRLANWLEGEKEQKVEADVLEAIYVISPEHCPEPRTRLEDVLGRVEFGPFGEGHEEDGTEEDEEYLRELLRHAPAPPIPKSSLEDILSRVQSGPFASLQEEETLLEQEKEDKESEDLPDNVVPLRPWWQRTEIAIFAAAAVALLILIPSNFTMPEQAEQNSVATKTVEREINAPEEADADWEEETPERASRQKTVSEKMQPLSRSENRSKDTEASISSRKKAKPKKAAPAEADFLKKKTMPAAPVLKEEAPMRPSTASLKSQERSVPVTEKMVEQKESLDTLSTSELSKNMDGMLGVTGADIVVAAVEEQEEQADFSRSDNDALEAFDAVQEISAVDEPTLVKAEGFTNDVIVADSEISIEEDIVEGEVVDEITIVPSSKRKAERKRKEIFGSMGSKKSAAPAAELMEASEPAPRATEEVTENRAAVNQQQRIVSLLSPSETQTLQGFSSSVEIADYAKQFNSTKALAALWQGTVNRDNQFAIDVLKNSEQFSSGQKIYLERNYQLLISLLIQEGRGDEAERYQQKLNALK